jgi:hypothetical protein
MARLDRVIALNIVLMLMARSSWAMTAKRGTSIFWRVGINRYGNV